MQAYLNYFSNTYDTPLRRMLSVGAKFAHRHNKEKEEASATASIANEIKISLCAHAWHIIGSCTVSCIVF